MEDRGPSIKRMKCGTCHHQNTLLITTRLGVLGGSSLYTKTGSCFQTFCESSHPSASLVAKHFSTLNYSILFSSIPAVLLQSIPQHKNVKKIGSEQKNNKISGSPKRFLQKTTKTRWTNKKYETSRLLNGVIARLSGVQQDQHQHCH